jgi:hypothetical protein
LGPYHGSLTNLLPVGFWTCALLKRQTGNIMTYELAW